MLVFQQMFSYFKACCSIIYPLLFLTLASFSIEVNT
jgi:hypothetical protein